MRADDNASLQSWLTRTKYKWLSHEVQNEMLELMAFNVLSVVLSDLQTAVSYSIMVDETTVCSTKEQIVLCFRHCDVGLQLGLQMHEVFARFCDLAQQGENTLFQTVTTVLQSFNIDLNECRGQCFDGAVNVAGRLSGLQDKIRNAEPRALFVHCLAHNMNLVVQDAVSTISAYRDALSLRKTITFIIDSSKRLKRFEHIQMIDANSLRPFCPTWWVFARVSFRIRHCKLR